jgi:hypothetical protein
LVTLLAEVLASAQPVAEPNSNGKSNEPFISFGLAWTSCGAFLEAMEGERRARPQNAVPDAIYSQRYGGYLDFADGFLTGANYAAATPNRTIGQANDHAGRMAWLENYCRQDPVGTYIRALLALREHLEAR